MVDEITSVLDPLRNFIFGLVEDRVHVLANILDILTGNTKHRLGVIWRDRKYNRDEGEERQERGLHCWRLDVADARSLRQSPVDLGTRPVVPPPTTW